MEEPLHRDTNINTTFPHASPFSATHRALRIAHIVHASRIRIAQMCNRQDNAFRACGAVSGHIRIAHGALCSDKHTVAR